MDEHELAQCQLNYQSLQDLMLLTSHEWRHHLTRLQVSLDVLSAKHAEQVGSLWEPITGTMHADIAMMRRIAGKYLAAMALQQDSYLHAQSFRLVDTVVEPLLVQFEGLLRHKRQSVVISFTPIDLCVWADPLMVSILYDNLLTNAINYGSEGGRIELTGCARQGWVDLSVWNSGSGLKPDTVQAMFEPFSRGEMRAGHQSTGIGLYLVRRIVEIHHGRIWVETEEAHGVRFHFQLPTVIHTDLNTCIEV